MLDQILATLAVVLIFVTSAYFYKHGDGKFREGKSVQIKSPKSFSAVYRYLQISCITFTIGSFWSEHPLFVKLYPFSVVALYFGLAVSFLFFAIFLSAKVTLGTSYSPCFESYVPRDFVQEGIYKFIRHPIYVANVGLLIGFFIATGSAVLLVNAVVLALYYGYSAKQEDKVLPTHLPGYAEYMKRTNAFFPKILKN
jgi:protein-S-isoprenylcysteine O-methyltransferase Ste14